MITETTSLCEKCYRHVPATVFEKDNNIWMSKTCKKHGYSEYIIENDSNFYHSLKYEPAEYNVPQGGVLVEVTDRCNLKCPHCYHEPDNAATDRPIDLIINQIQSLSNVHDGIILAGAEPTVRNDLDKVVAAVSKMFRDTSTQQFVSVLTNGVRFHDQEFTKRLKDAGLCWAMIGLNHHSYQGKVVHKKQLSGIKNCLDLGINLFYIGYTLENLDHIPEVLEEIQQLGNIALQYRIRAGSDIGRNPDEPRYYLSDHVKAIKAYADSRGWTWEKMRADDNLYHYMVKINGIAHRLLQWCDVKTIDLEELRTGPWCDFIPNKPATNFLHQIILRDAAVNKDLMLYDTVPKRFRLRSRAEINLESKEIIS
jgi:molybdenum cofactor biosynthesis enzyme MoaA